MAHLSLRDACFVVAPSDHVCVTDLCQLYLQVSQICVTHGNNRVIPVAHMSMSGACFVVVRSDHVYPETRMLLSTELDPVVAYLDYLRQSRAGSS